MSSERLKQIAIGLAVLVVLWLGSEAMRRRSDGEGDTFALPQITMATTDSLILERSNDTIVLAKVDDVTWTVNGNRAAYSTVSDLFTDLEGASSGELVAQSEGTHARLEIGDGEARALKVYSGGALTTDLLLGKQGRTYRDVYVRLPGAAEVYSLAANLPSHLNRTMDQWRDRSLTAVTPDSVAALDLRRGNVTRHLTRDSTTWRIDGGDTADSTAMVTLLRQFQALSAIAFPTEAQRDSIDFTRPDRLVVLRGVAGDTLAALELDSLLNGFWVRKMGDTTVYRVSTSTADRIVPTDSVLHGN